MSTPGIRDEEDGTLCGVSCCAPVRALTRPVEVEDPFTAGYQYVKRPSHSPPPPTTFGSYTHTYTYTQSDFHAYDDEEDEGHPSLTPNISGNEDAFFVWPFFGPLLFENTTSDARDNCANERTFLSYLRLSVYMAIVSVAIVLSFHLKTQPSPAELRMAKPLGVIFWVLSVACLFVGLGNYIQTVNKYSRKAAIVQSGIKTQLTMGIVSLAIIATCVTLLVVNRTSENLDSVSK
ncbi:hypothetical protein VPNG_01677 [Cytospora leucostoma]|uniref:DUF202 domain-containing protein n=1 Tax=Cytospora leucostoma TaxID=1230097 RepID=A0A423XJT4_9PEZI|nr:hypothetical protein VPNG_01677 [Cytospora leucostoma]